MKIISLQQPYATLLIFGKINRIVKDYTSPYKGLCLIHSCLAIDHRKMMEVEKDVHELDFYTGNSIKAKFLVDPKKAIDKYLFNIIIGIATLDRITTNYVNDHETHTYHFTDPRFIDNPTLAENIFHMDDIHYSFFITSCPKCDRKLNIIHKDNEDILCPHCLVSLDLNNTTTAPDVKPKLTIKNALNFR